MRGRVRLGEKQGKGKLFTHLVVQKTINKKNTTSVEILALLG